MTASVSRGLQGGPIAVKDIFHDAASDVSFAS